MNSEFRIQNSGTRQPHRARIGWLYFPGFRILSPEFWLLSHRRIRSALGWLTVAFITSGCTLQDWLGNDPASYDLKTIVGFINHVINYLGAFGGLVAALVMIAGYQSLLSAGSDEGIQRAKDTIKYSALGMVFIVFGYALVKLVFATLAAGTNPFTNL